MFDVGLPPIPFISPSKISRSAPASTIGKAFILTTTVSVSEQPAEFATIN